MLSPEQLKGRIRNLALEKGISSQEILQMYLFERIIDRLSKSRYSKNFILKGGFLIASMVGIDERTTMDIDTTVSGLPMETEEIVSVFKEILNIDVGDNIKFDFLNIEPIRKSGNYNDYRIHFYAKYGKINNPMKMDITTGDIITPAAIEYKYKSIMYDKVIRVFSYNIETILAEKFATIIQRNIGNTRARDYYDLYTLFKIYKDDINKSIMRKAIDNTFNSRGISLEYDKFEDIISIIFEDASIIQLWNTYQNEYNYARHIGIREIETVTKDFTKFVYDD